MKCIYKFDEFQQLREQLGSISAISQLIGRKATNLCQIKEQNIKIPNGIILSSEAHKHFVENKGVNIPEDLWEDILQELRPIEDDCKLKYGSPKTPLLLSVRGDAPEYMVGMLDTVTYIGLNDLTARAMERMTQNRSFVWDCYRRLVQEYGVVVLKIPTSEFEKELELFRQSRNLQMFSAFSALDFIELTKINKAVIIRKTGRPFPQDPFEQLRKVICAVFASQSLSRVKLFKTKSFLPQINVASLMIMPMLFGNRSITTSSTVIATRDLVNGAPNILGEFAVNATCRDISLSQRDPLPLENLSKENSDLFNKVTTISKTLEKHFKKPQIVDFVYENGEVYVMQSSNAQLTAPGRFRAAKDMVEGGLITKEESLCNFEPDDVCQLLAPKLAGAEPSPFCKGLSSGNACVVGKVCLTNEAVIDSAKKNESAILVKKSIHATDYEAVMAASAVVTSVGSNLSFVASITRLFRKTAALGCDGLIIDLTNNCIKTSDNNIINAGEIITVTGEGNVLKDAQELINPESQEDEFAKEVLSWADEIRKEKINVFALAATATEVKNAVSIGSDGVGTLSLEPFFEGEDRRYITDIIDPSNEEAVNAFEGYLTEKLKDIISSIGSKTITIRLFDPELTSYLSTPIELAKEIGNLRAQKDRDADAFASQEELDSKVAELESMKKARKANPSLGSRSIRLLIERPELMTAELKSILNATKDARASGADPQTRILVPYISDYRELSNLTKTYEALSLEIGEKAKIGVEVETPRACLTAAKIAEFADFINLSIPQLTGATFAMDRIDAERQLLEVYKEKKIIANNIFNGTAVNGCVAELMKICTHEAKQTKADGEIGLFSEEFNNPKAINHYTELGVNSFICRPPAVPIARLCAAKTLIGKH